MFQCLCFERLIPGYVNLFDWNDLLQGMRGLLDIMSVQIQLALVDIGLISSYGFVHNVSDGAHDQMYLITLCEIKNVNKINLVVAFMALIQFSLIIHCIKEQAIWLIYIASKVTWKRRFFILTEPFLSYISAQISNLCKIG